MPSAFEPIQRPADHPLVKLAIENDIATLTLCDVTRRNALRIELSLDLARAVGEALHASVGAIILAAEPPVFCSGGDLDDLLTPRASLSDIGLGAKALLESPVPTIAAVNGPVIGAGINLVLACDVILCSPSAKFDPRLLDLGVHPGGGQLRSLAHRIGRQGAVALSLLGDTLDGIEAAQMGLAWRCVSEEELLAVATTFARRAVSRPREAMDRAKMTLDATIHASQEEAISEELLQQQWSLSQPWIAERVGLLRERLDQRASGK